MLPEVDRWGQDLRRRRVASVLLAFSVVTATCALANPWQHSLLFAWLEYLGWISYQ
jgi:peptidoglycan/LPS O-acetylase OafA/YrhL